jgi:5-methylcytosine-specific restriction endonuclease McrA
MVTQARSVPPDLGDKHRILNNHEPSWWLRLQLDALVAGWEANGVRACKDIRRNPGHDVGVTALYRRDALACSDCLDVFRLKGSPDHECDRCHEQFDTLAGVVYDTHLEGMRLLVMFGLCPGCEAKEISQ